METIARQRLVKSVLGDEVGFDIDGSQTLSWYLVEHGHGKDFVVGESYQFVLTPCRDCRELIAVPPTCEDSGYMCDLCALVEDEEDKIAPAIIQRLVEKYKPANSEELLQLIIEGKHEDKDITRVN